MRSWPSLVLVVALGCGNDRAVGDDEVDPDRCETSYLTYNNFGEPFALDWCRGCHSSDVPMNMRQKAPIDVNFDSHEDIMTWRERIESRATGDEPTMPPAGGPGEAERALLGEWLACGARKQ
ncbi:MAG TPA: hypothetical protein VIU61_12820 [Kofleriaceae bacterium]